MKTRRLVPHYNVEVVLTRREIAVLMSRSANHYDGVCRAAGKLGGFLYGINNRLLDVDVVEVEVTADELNLLMKICERGPILLYRDLREAFDSIQKKYVGVA
jgi:hypothetical protein